MRIASLIAKTLSTQFRRRCFQSAASILPVLILAAGCGDSETVATWTPDQRIVDASLGGGDATDRLRESDLAIDGEPAGVNDEPFEPPYPMRTDPFQFIGEERVLVTTTEPVNVRVKGFVNVGGPQAIISVDGKTYIVSEGDRVAGVNVLQLSEPNVRLRTVNRSWTASLFDSADPTDQASAR